MAKRKVAGLLEASKPPVKPRKRQAFTAPHDALTKSTIKRNAAESPLLRLPLEIRMKIWKEVLGDHQVHIVRIHRSRDPHAPSELDGTVSRGTSYDPRIPLRHYLCIQEQSEAAIYKQWRSDIEQRSAKSAHYWKKHYNCCMVDYKCEYPLCTAPNCHGAERSSRKLQLGLLRACRQIYVETNEVLWSTNTFSFEEIVLLRHFMAQRNAMQKRLLKKIHLKWVSPPPYRTVYRRPTPLSLATINAFRGLQTLHLNIVASFKPHWAERWTEEESTRQTLVRDVLIFRALPLKVVTVTYDAQVYLPTLVDLPAAQRLELAESIRTRLLDPDGADVYADVYAEEAKRVKALRLDDGNTEGPGFWW
ncbi:hypothetical protein MMC11_004682 [Xylographa trunciseda]|nr:hypothetical protein [Xylographa trunciseda]